MKRFYAFTRQLITNKWQFHCLAIRNKKWNRYDIKQFKCNWSLFVCSFCRCQFIYFLVLMKMFLYIYLERGKFVLCIPLHNRMLLSKIILIFFICKIEVHCVNEMSQSSTMILDDEAIMQPVELHVSEAVMQVLLLT